MESVQLPSFRERSKEIVTACNLGDLDSTKDVWRSIWVGLSRKCADGEAGDILESNTAKGNEMHTLI